MKRILILGVNGFIGHHLSKRIVETTDWEVYGMDMQTDRVEDLLGHDRFHFFDCPACDGEGHWREDDSIDPHGWKAIERAPVVHSRLELRDERKRPGCWHKRTVHADVVRAGPAHAQDRPGLNNVAVLGA